MTLLLCSHILLREFQAIKIGWPAYARNKCSRQKWTWLPCLALCRSCCFRPCYIVGLSKVPNFVWYLCMIWSSWIGNCSSERNLVWCWRLSANVTRANLQDILKCFRRVWVTWDIGARTIDRTSVCSYCSQNTSNKGLSWWWTRRWSTRRWSRIRGCATQTQSGTLESFVPEMDKIFLQWSLSLTSAERYPLDHITESHLLQFSLFHLRWASPAIA